MRLRGDLMQYDLFLEAIQNPLIKEKVISLVDFVQKKYPELTLEMKWNQPMFTHHGSFIIGFSTAKTHVNIAPEDPAIKVFKDRLDQLGYKQTKMLIQIKDKQTIDFDFIQTLVDYMIEEKKDIKTFWK
jgi:uncharacterized protein YdhG (YjbR/CyaY superfamily)